MTESLWYHFESELTPQVARIWTETSPNSKLKNINEELNSPKRQNIGEIKELKQLIQSREYKKFQKKIWLTWSKNLDWKLWKTSLESFNNYLKILEQIKHNQQDTRQQLDDLWASIRNPQQITTTDNGNTEQITASTSAEEAQNISDNIEINRAAKKLLSKHEKLSEGEYNKIFAGKDIIQQWQLWDCYLVSWIIELSNTQYFDTLMRTSIKRVQFKDDNSLWYSIKIPLWEPNGRDILIKDSELDIAKIKWNIGYKLLEISYVKNRRPNDSEWNKYSPVTESEFAEIWKWWSSTIVLRTFLGKHNIWFNDFWTANTWKNRKTLSDLSRERKLEITNFLKHYNWNIWNRFIFLWTADFGTDSFYVWNNLFYTKHSYAISSVKLDWKWRIEEIHLKNPGNDPSIEWWSDAKINLNEFFNAFSYIEACKVNTNTFLRV